MITHQEWRHSQARVAAEQYERTDSDSNTYLREAFVGKLLVQFIQHFFGCENSSSVGHMTNMLDLTRSPFCVDPFLFDDIDLNQSDVSIGGNKGLLQRNASSCVLHVYLH